MHEISLEGMHVLVLEDEVLIAMDVEQLCRDCGAADVTIVRDLDQLGPDPFAGEPFHAAVLDVMLAGRSTVDFARELFERRIPFVFATGYTDTEGLLDAFAGVEIVDKPYSSTALIKAVAAAMARLRGGPSGGV